MAEPLRAVPLAPLTTMQVGGKAEYFVEARSDDELIAAVDWARQRAVPLKVLGGGSNVVVADGGFDGLVVQVATRGIRSSVSGDRLRVSAAAGHNWDELVAWSVAQGAAGLECLSGIPGRVGASPIQNVGAYGQEVADTIVAVRCLDRARAQVVELAAQDCAFAYRDSRFKSQEPERFVVLEVSYDLVPGGAANLRYGELARRLEQVPATDLTAVRHSVLAIRQEKSMLARPDDENARSCGSFFVNPVVSPELADRIERDVAPQAMPRYPAPDGVKLAAAWLIERAGFGKGQRWGNVGLSTRHTLALVAHGPASANELVAFAHHVRARVQERFGVLLVPEPNFWGFAQLDRRLPTL